jgi:ribose 5-phosphate isomerase B
MTIYLGADHRGFALAQELKARLAEQGRTVIDCGGAGLDPDDDYPDIASRVVERVLVDREGCGVLVCGSGNGMAIAANRHPGIRAALCMNVLQAQMARQDEDANIISLAADFTDASLARDMVKAFLDTGFSQADRHMRRIHKLG